jgi:hypothetical protein
MNVRCIHLAAMLTAAWPALSASPPLQNATDAGRAWHVFHGTNLAGFETWLVDSRHANPRGVFTITNGTLRISGDGLGYLATTNDWQDYTLTLEYRWGATNSSWGDRLGKARDSGVFLHATGPHGNSFDGTGAFMAAIECNIFEGATGDFLLIRGTNASGTAIHPRIAFAASSRSDADGFRWFEPGGTMRTLERWGRVNWRNKSTAWRDHFGFRGDRDVEKPAGEWNRLEIACHGRRIAVKLNGALVNEAFDVWPNRGRILLQCEGSEIFFRNGVIQFNHE